MKLLADLLRTGLNSWFIGHIKNQGNKIFPKLCRKPFGIFHFADTAKDSKTLLDQNFQNAPPDPCGNTGHDDASHGSLLEIILAPPLMILAFRHCGHVAPGLSLFYLSLCGLVK